MSNKNGTEDKIENANDDDDLVKKLKNIPILPRIPKRQSNPSFKDENEKNLEHKSILEHREVISFTNDQWKSSGWTSTFSGTSKPRNLRENIKPNSKQSKQTILRRNFSESNIRSCELKFDDMITGKLDKVNENTQEINETTPKLILKAMKTNNFKSFKTQKHIESKIDVNKSPKSKLSQDLPLNLIVDFECFESRWTSELPRPPCKSLEDRMRERMLFKQSNSQQESDNKIENLLNNTDQLYSSQQEPAKNDDSELTTNFDSSNLCNEVYSDTNDCKNENLSNSNETLINTLELPFISKDSFHNINDPKIIDSITMPPPSMPPPTSKKFLRRKKTANINIVPTNTPLSGGNYENKPLWGKITKIQEDTLADLNGLNGRKVTFDCPEAEIAQNISKLGSDKNIKVKEKIAKNSYKSKNQAIVVGAMKQLLKPLYKRQKVDKQQYKDIMRDAVTKISRNENLINNKLLILESGKRIITKYLKDEKVVKTK